MAQAESGDLLANGLAITVYARVTGGGYRAAIGVRRRDDDNPLEWVCELPEIFARAELAKAVASDFAACAGADGGWVRLLENWESSRSRRGSVTGD